MKESENENTAMSKVLFNLAEGLGSLLSSSSSTPSSRSMPSFRSSSPSVDIKVVGDRIRDDYERLFWVTGDGDWDLWKTDCTFADPFSSFGGEEGSLERFKRNAKNLGGLVRNPIGKVRSFEIKDLDGGDMESIDKYIVNSKNNKRGVERSENTENTGEYRSVKVVKVGWSFTGKLRLPWNPTLSATGVTSHFVDNNDGKIFLYLETWKSKPLDVVKRLLKPTKLDVGAEYDS